MEPEREEVYERIPWETLEPASGNRQWLVYAVAAALVLGALAYSFTRNQQVTPAPQAETPVLTSTVPATTATSAAGPTPSTAASPVVVAEADLYAVDPERLVDLVAAHAEWFATEYISYDGSDESASTLAELLPDGVPLPEAPEGTQVFVDWARATNVTQYGSVAFEVEVIIRSLLAPDGSAFTRQPPQRLVVPVELDDDGRPRISRPPAISGADPLEPAQMSLQVVPPEVVEALGVEGEVVGGLRGAEGQWLVVVMTPGPDGVRRPVTLEAPDPP
jgi:hypothetical protein